MVTLNVTSLLSIVPSLTLTVMVDSPVASAIGVMVKMLLLTLTVTTLVSELFATYVKVSPSSTSVPTMVMLNATASSTSL